MKKLINVWIIGGFAFVMLAFYGSLIFWAVSCEKDDLNTQITTAPGTEFKEAIIDTTIYDSRINNKTANGFVDIIILGNKYKGQNGLALFLQTADSVKKYLSTIYPMDSLSAYLRFHYKNVKQDLGCNDNVSIAEGWVCNETKVINTALDIANGAFNIDQVIVLAYGDGRGGADGSSTCAIGVGTMQSNATCNIWNGIKGKVRHEFFHNICGMNHPPCYPIFNVMCTCGNGCCDVANAPLLPEHQQLVTNYINSRIN